MLAAVSLGPGDTSLLTPAARHALEDADVIVGYKGYISLLPISLLHGKSTISTGMMGEVERANAAIEAAQSGKKTVMVCSGDAGIYAMAGLLLEILDANKLLESIPFSVIPGVSAFNSAAALLGAPLMHDFASISLSDLLTPWSVIEKRLALASEADFVIALYNPRSRKRHAQLDQALSIIGRHRLPTTPVGIVGRAYRDGQDVRIVTLEHVKNETIDMQTTLIIGNSATRRCGPYMLTPRGYHRKYDMVVDSQKS